MKKLLLFLLTLSNARVVGAQNLVPNPNFALYNTCPGGVGKLDTCKYWHNPGRATPDYHNACHDTLPGSTHSVGVPANFAGTQSSPSNAYIGIITFGTSANVREYARTDISALTVGAIYRVLIRISLAECSYYATNAPSVFFYEDAYIDATSRFNIPYTPQVAYSAAGNITDVVNWVTLVGSFTSDSAYTHLIVGNFNNDALTPKTNVGGFGCGMDSYYYIDSISVEQIGFTTFTNSNTYKEIKATLHPNPFTESAVLTLENFPGGDNTLCIMNAQGAVVRKMDHIGNGRITISRDGLNPGFYYYQVRTQEGIVLNGKMVVQ